MAVQLQKLYQTSTAGDLPSETASNWVQGINAPGGPVEFFMIRADLVYTALGVPYTTDFGQLISSLRIILNGEVLFDFRSGQNSNTGTTESTFNYLINNIGGRSYEVPSTGDGATKEAYVAIPIGRQTPAGVNRWEIVMGWAAGATTPASGSVEYWIQTNDAMQDSVTVVPSTSFTHAAAIEMVTVKVPQNLPAGSVVSALLVQNLTNAADNLGTQGMMIRPISQFGIEAQMWRFMNGDLSNGNLSAIGGAADTGITQQQFNLGIPGVFLLPTFGLTGGDIVLQVDSSAAVTRTYTPIITASVGARQVEQVRQTQIAPGNSAKAIIAPALD